MNLDNDKKRQADLKSLPLRERKKVQTRLRLVEAAHRLFISEGYETATLDRICEEADVSIATFRRYFESKERLALEVWHAFAEEATEVFLGDREKPTLAVWREYIPNLWPKFVEFVAQGKRPSQDDAFVIWRIIHTTPELLAERTILEREVEDVLAESLARDAGLLAAVDLHSRVVASALLSTTRIVFHHWANNGQPGEWPVICDAVTDLVERLFPSRADFGHAREASDSAEMLWLLQQFSAGVR